LAKPRTRKTLRSLSNEQVRVLLTEYVETKITQAKLARKYGVSQSAISSVVRGTSYREVPGISDLRKKAQAKAAALSAKWTSEEAVRVPDPKNKVIEYDDNSIESIDAVILRLLARRSLLIGSAVEVDRARVGGGVTTKSKTEQVPLQ
jgi:transcriptional regulator with XRE-family HTH domain